MGKRKAGKKSVAKTEQWKSGRYSVTRSSRGTFVSWHKIRVYKNRRAARGWRVSGFASVGRKHVAAYGRTSSNKTGKVKHNRIEISGKGNEIYDALKMMFGSGYVPRRPYQHVSAEDLNDEPFEYLEGGEWIDREVES